MDFLMLAQAAGDATDVMPTWAKLVVGPLGALAGSIAWIIYTERVRMPRLTGLLATTQEKVETVRKVLEDKMEAREERLQIAVRNCRNKYTKERTARVWWQGKALDFAERLGEKTGIPQDIDKTSSGALDDFGDEE